MSPDPILSVGAALAALALAGEPAAAAAVSTVRPRHDRLASFPVVAVPTPSTGARPASHVSHSSHVSHFSSSGDPTVTVTAEPPPPVTLTVTPTPTPTVTVSLTPTASGSTTLPPSASATKTATSQAAPSTVDSGSGIITSTTTSSEHSDAIDPWVEELRHKPAMSSDSQAVRTAGVADSTVSTRTGAADDASLALGLVGAAGLTMSAAGGFVLYRRKPRHR